MLKTANEHVWLSVNGDAVVYPSGPSGTPGNGSTTATDVESVRFALTQTATGRVLLQSRTWADDKNNVKTRTPFDFGPDLDAAHKDVNTVFLTKDALAPAAKITAITIEGEKPVAMDEPANVGQQAVAWKHGVAEGTAIKGGRLPFVVGVTSLDQITVPPLADKLVPVTIKNIRFEEFYRCAIRVYATAPESTEISDCTFVDYTRSKTDAPVPGAFPIVVSQRNASNSPQALAGQLHINCNYFGPCLNADTYPPDDPNSPLDPQRKKNNLVHVDTSNFTLVEFRDNRFVDLSRFGIAVFGNNGKTVVAGNVITNDVPKPECFGSAISVGIDPKLASAVYDDDITVEGNFIRVAAPDKFGILAGLTLPSSKLRIQSNAVELVKTANSSEDNRGRAAIACIGAACGSPNAWVEDNHVYGEGPYGMWLAANLPPADDPANSVPNLTNAKPGSGTQVRDNILVYFRATRAQVFVGQDVSEMEFGGNSLGNVGLNNPFFMVNETGPERAWRRAGVYWRGRWGVLSKNSFAWSKIDGWLKSNVGSIYLDTASHDNYVWWRDWQFPPAPGFPLPENQIWDAGMNNKVLPESYLVPHLFPHLWLRDSAWWHPTPEFARPLMSLALLGQLAARAFESGSSDGGAWSPAIEVRQKDSRLVVTAELPGFKTDDIKVTAAGGTLTLEGERKRGEDMGYVLSERGYGQFARSVALPKGANIDGVTAVLKDGVLEVVVPLAETKGRAVAVS